jgi:hypothetical protein
MGRRLQAPCCRARFSSKVQIASTMQWTGRDLAVEVLAASNSSLTDGGDPVLSRGGVRGGGGGVTARSADSRLDRPVAAGVVLCGDGVLQLLVRASAWLCVATSASGAPLVLAATQASAKVSMAL